MDHPDTLDQWSMHLLAQADAGQEIFIGIDRSPGTMPVLRPWLPCHRLDNEKPTLLFLGQHLEILDGWARDGDTFIWSPRRRGWRTIKNTDPLQLFVEHLSYALHGTKAWFEARPL